MYFCVREQQQQQQQSRASERAASSLTDTEKERESVCNGSRRHLKRALLYTSLHSHTHTHVRAMNVALRTRRVSIIYGQGPYFSIVFFHPAVSLSLLWCRSLALGALLSRRMRDGHVWVTSKLQSRAVSVCACIVIDSDECVCVCVCLTSARASIYRFSLPVTPPELRSSPWT